MVQAKGEIISQEQAHYIVPEEIGGKSANIGIENAQ